MNRKLKRLGLVAASVLAVVAPVFPNTPAEAKPHRIAPQPPPPSPTLPMTSPIILGYYTQYYAGDNASYISLVSYGTNLNTMSTVTWNATSNGGITGSAPTSAITQANSDGIKSYAVVTDETNGSFDAALAHSILGSPTVTQTFVSNLVSTVRNNGYTGINIDFEGMYANDRSSFSQFINELATSLHTSGYKLIVSVPAETSDQPANSWTGTFDYNSLGKAADYLQLMTYDEHGSWGTPGPVASYPWVQNVVQYAASTITPGKILLGLAAYGYDWNTTTNTGNKAVAWKNISSLLSTTGAVPSWDSSSDSPYFHYTASDGTSHVVWYENAQSIEDKEQLVKQYALGGVAMWRLGLEDSGFWTAVKTGLGQ